MKEDIVASKKSMQNQLSEVYEKGGRVEIFRFVESMIFNASRVDESRYCTPPMHFTPLSAPTLILPILI